MNVREHFRRYRVTGADWHAMGDSAREYVRFWNRPAWEPQEPTPRALHAKLLDLARDFRGSSVPYTTYAKSVRLAGFAPLPR